MIGAGPTALESITIHGLDCAKTMGVTRFALENTMWSFDVMMKDDQNLLIFFSTWLELWAWFSQLGHQRIPDCLSIIFTMTQCVVAKL